MALADDVCKDGSLYSECSDLTGDKLEYSPEPADNCEKVRTEQTAEESSAMLLC